MIASNSPRRYSRATFADVCTVESLFRHKILAFCILLAGIGLTVFVLFSRERTFDSMARVFLRMGRESVADATTTVSGQSVQISDAQKREMQSVQDILRSNVLHEKIVDRIGVEQILNYQDDFTEKNAPSPYVEILKSPIGNLKAFLATIRLADADNPRGKAIATIEKQIKTTAEDDSNIFSIRVRSKSPKLSQEIGTVILEEFSELHRKAHNTPGAYNFFSEQLKTVKEELDKAMIKLRDAKNEYGFASIGSQHDVLTDRVKAIGVALQAAMQDVKGAEAKVGEMESSLNQLPERVLASEVIGLTNTSRDEMRGQLYILELEYSELLAKYTKENPLVIRKKAQLDDAKGLYKDEDLFPQKTTSVNATREAVSVQHLISKAAGAEATAKALELKSQYEQTLADIRSANEKEIELQTLQREIDVLDGKYRTYAKSLEQARIDEALQRDNLSSINIIQPPSFNDDPTDLSNTVIAAAGLFCSFFASIGAAFGRRFLRNDLESADDVERELEIPVLGVVPNSRQRKIVFQA